MNVDNDAEMARKLQKELEKNKIMDVDNDESFEFKPETIDYEAKEYKVQEKYRQLTMIINMIIDRL